MALKPSPVQVFHILSLLKMKVTWIGYPNTTGLTTIDYRFSDELADPPAMVQSYSEKVT